jgi:DNA-binding IclR family transcriptional regulator
VPAPERGLTVLEAIARSRSGLGYGELSALGVPSASLVRILRTLHRRGFLRQPSGTNRYRLGLRLHALGTAALASLEVVQEASAVLPRLAAETGETAELVLLDGDELTWAAPASRPAPRPPGGTPGG